MSSRRTLERAAGHGALVGRSPRSRCCRPGHTRRVPALCRRIESAPSYVQICTCAGVLVVVHLTLVLSPFIGLQPLPALTANRSSMARASSSWRSTRSRSRVAVRWRTGSVAHHRPAAIDTEEPRPHGGILAVVIGNSNRADWPVRPGNRYPGPAPSVRGRTGPRSHGADRMIRLPRWLRSGPQPLPITVAGHGRIRHGQFPVDKRQQLLGAALTRAGVPAVVDGTSIGGRERRRGRRECVHDDHLLAG